MDAVKIFLITILSTVIAFLAPIHNAVIFLGLAFLADFVFGVLVDLIVNDDRLRIKKALFALLFLLLYSMTITYVFVGGYLMGDVDKSMIIVKALTYIFVAFYTANTLRNLTLLFPNSRVFAFMYHIFGLQVLKKMPVLYNFIFGGKEKKNENE